MKPKKRLWSVYLTGFLLAVHFASVSYVNSSLLRNFVGDSWINIFYIIGSAAGVTLLLIIPSIVRRFGSVITFLALSVLEILAVFGMGSMASVYLVIFWFLIHISVDSTLLFCLDINLEQETEKESTTGAKRGLMFAIANSAWVLSPLALIFLANQNNFSQIYFLSGLALVPVLLIVSGFFKNTQKASARESNILASVTSLFKGGDVARAIFIQFILNFFYAWMVIYLPLLLNRQIGFGWDKIGLIFMVMLLPFLIFELPAGIISDRRLGEKEFLVAGLIIMGMATLAIPFISVAVFWIWALVLFITRVGASLVEVSTESYFFKHVQEDDTGLISLFRTARPFSYVVAPLFALPVVFYFSYSASFYFLALFVLLGLFFIPKVDTK